MPFILICRAEKPLRESRIAVSLLISLSMSNVSNGALICSLNAVIEMWCHVIPLWCHRVSCDTTVMS